MVLVEHRSFPQWNNLINSLNVVMKYKSSPIFRGRQCGIMFDKQKDNVESAIVPDYQDKTAEIVVELEKGTVHLLPYQSIQQQVEQGSVRLL
uniref:SLD5_C domain-containing protein n=1 Tax=Angiostrongylus cantonensis TaxID=6313 RepID=A0A0K0CXF0_ANGCA